MSSDAPRLSRQDLYQIAIYQKVILLCILVYFVALIAQFLLPLPQEARLLLVLPVLGLGVVATVFVFLLALKVYSTGVGIVLGLLTLIPGIGLLALLVINQKATGVLNRHGYKVGLLGASLSQFKDS